MGTDIGKKISCDCPYCQGSTDPSVLLNKSIAQGHYLYQKSKISKMLSTMNEVERSEWFTKTTVDAIESLKQIKKDTKYKKLYFDHMKSWLAAIADAEKAIRRVDAETIHMSVLN